VGKDAREARIAIVMWVERTEQQNPGMSSAAPPSALTGLLSAPPTMRIGEARVHALGEATCIDFVLQQLTLGRGGWILTLNLQHLRLAARDPAYAALCDTATLAVADGMPLVWASRLQGTALPGRVTGSNLISSLTAVAAARDRSIFLLGGAPGTADASAAILRRRHPHLRVVGTLCPALGFERHQQTLAALRAALTGAHPDIVFIALDTPRQDWLIGQLREHLPHAWFIGVGSGFSFLCGALRRAPQWMQRGGLEWLHRLAQEPTRLGKRYLLEGLPFACGLLGRALWRRYRNGVVGDRRAGPPPTGYEQ